MKTILVLSNHPDFAETIRAGLNPEQYRVVHHLGVDEAEPLLAHGLVGACILDIDLMDVEIVWVVERIRRRDAKCPIIAYTIYSESAWEEEAFLHGITLVLTKPVRTRLLSSLFERLLPPITNAPRTTVNVPAGNTAIFARATADPDAAGRFVKTAQTLDVLRGFSSILSHSLNAEAMLKQFLLFLR
ncbi:MAG: response regulator [Limisphaerales bacterium]